VNIVTKMFCRFVKASAQGALAALVLLPMTVSASITFELDFGCTPGERFDTCTDGTDAGGGNITFPELGPAYPAAPYPGVDLDLTFLSPASLSFTEADITYIAWAISLDGSTLTWLNLTLDSDPSYTTDEYEIGEHQYASVYISMDSGGTWDAGQEGCEASSAGAQCYRTITAYANRTTTAFPAVVPVPAAVWLFGSGMLGLIGVARRNKAV
jgi:hypothetical protein